MAKKEYIVRYVEKRKDGHLYADGDDMVVLVLEDEGEGEKEKKYLCGLYCDFYNQKCGSDTTWAEQVVVDAADVDKVLLKEGDLIR